MFMKKKTFIILILLSSLAVLLSLFAGPSLINPFGMDEISSTVLFSIRLPRVVVAVLVGAALGASGAVLQGILRNPLADPYILGISSGAALLAAFGLIVSSVIFGAFTIPLLAFIGSVVTCLVVGAMGYRSGVLHPERLLLAGIGLGFLFTAVLMLMMSLSTSQGMRRAMLWIFGDLSMADWSLIPVAALFVPIGLGLTLWRAKGLNALMLGDETAHSLGFSPTKERLILFIAVGLLTATAVSLGGIIGFIGLLVPHIVRFTTGADARVLVPMSAITGAGALALADVIGRSVISPAELPSGIVTAIIGAPYFLYLLRKKEVVGL